MASLTDFGVTACDSTGKALDMCGTTDVWAQLNNNWSSWTDFYNHWITSVVQQDWSFLSTSFCWMKESYSNRSMYTFRPSTGTVSQAARDEQSNYALCIIPDVH